MPWLLHTLPVNTLNFCAFSMCYATEEGESSDCQDADEEAPYGPENALASILVAVPSRDDKKAEVYQFPEEKLRYVVPRAQSKDTGKSYVTIDSEVLLQRLGRYRHQSAIIVTTILTNAGMVMAVKLVQDPIARQTLVITGYEGGITAVHLLPRDDGSAIGVAHLIYLSQPHTQPILSLDVVPDAKTYFTSGADAIIAAHRIPSLPSRDGAVRIPQPIQEDEDDPPVSVPSQDSEALPPATSHATIEDDDKDNVADDPPVSIPEDVDGQSLSFSKRPVHAPTQSKESAPKAGGLSSLLSNVAPSSKAAQSIPPLSSPPSIQVPSKVNNTKHAGQQSLSVRSDGRLLATGGWDSRVRIYSTKTLKEVAVLKWHKEGVYAVAFGKILDGMDLEHNIENAQSQAADGEVTRKESGLSKLQRQREEKMQVKHWIAAGAKDGKISLWEVF